MAGTRSGSTAFGAFGAWGGRKRAVGGRWKGRGVKRGKERRSDAMKVTKREEGLPVTEVDVVTGAARGGGRAEVEGPVEEALGGAKR